MSVFTAALWFCTAALGNQLGAVEAETADEPIVIKVQPIQAEARPMVAQPTGPISRQGRPIGCGPRFQAPSGLTALAVADAERQSDGRLLCAWLVTALGADQLELVLTPRGHSQRDRIEVLRADGLLIASVDGAHAGETPVLTVPSTVVVRILAANVTGFDGLFARVYTPSPTQTPDS